MSSAPFIHKVNFGVTVFTTVQHQHVPSQTVLASSQSFPALYTYVSATDCIQKSKYSLLYCQELAKLYYPDDHSDHTIFLWSCSLLLQTKFLCFLMVMSGLCKYVVLKLFWTYRPYALSTAHSQVQTLESFPTKDHLPTTSWPFKHPRWTTM